jgi:phage terminase small subunit
MTKNKKPTSKQEAFCLAVVDPNVPDATAAYRSAYETKNMKPATINRAATALMQNYTITTRIEELRAPVIDKLQITLEAVVVEIAKTAFANVADYLEIGENGKATLTLTDITPDQMAAIKKVKTSEIKDSKGEVTGYSNELELGDKLKALEMLGRHVGVFPNARDIVDQSITVNTTVNMTRVELARRMAYIIEDGFLAAAEEE